MTLHKLMQLGLLSGTLLFGASISTAHAMNPLHSSYRIQMELDTDDWKVIRTQQGIIISYAIITEKEEQFLSVRFENTAAQPVDFVWSLTKDSVQLQITADEMRESRLAISPAGSRVFDGTYLIPITSSENFSDFNVTLTPIKH